MEKDIGEVIADIKGSGYKLSERDQKIIKTVESLKKKNALTGVERWALGVVEGKARRWRAKNLG